jgi:heme/copper-type cytochrome/quinol oxidase subunit 4
MNTKSKFSNHNVIFILLAVLAFFSVGTTFLSLSPGLNNWYVFGIAAIMASLVLIQYMDLKSEGFLVYAFFIVPVVLFAILVVLVGLASPNGPRIF